MGDAISDPLTFGQWLRRRRKSLDLTQDELAARVPCAKGTVRRLESDDLRPSKQLAERLAEVLGVPEQSRVEFVAFARNGIEASRDDAAGFTFANDGGVARSAPAIAAAPQPHLLRRHGLPTPANALIGRAHTVAVVSELLLQPDVRLLTLIGPPGVGKTRLALQVADAAQEKFRDGACFVALAPVSDADRVLPAVAQALDLLDSGRPIAAALADRLRSERLLLMLDNFEHVVEAAPLVAELLAAAPGLKVLCTSRVALRISGENEFAVPPLALPDLAHLSNTGELTENPAVALFVARARAIQPSFTITDNNASAIAEICHRLDGLPLAIELAATRVKLYSPAALLARLERRLPFLTGGPRDVPARQRTLEAAIAWSYDLLDDAEKICLARLGVFWGGWTLDVAEVICGGEMDAAGALASLIDKSLVQATDAGDGEPRFSMLETVREFALARLNERGEMEEIQSRHAHHFLSLAIEAEHGLQGADQVQWMRRLNDENNNLRAALAWSLSTAGDAELGLRAAAALWWFWWTNGQVSEGRRWLADLLARGGSDAARARASLGAGILAFFAGDFAAATPLFEFARDATAQTDDPITHGYAIFMIGTVQTLSGDPAGGGALTKRGAHVLRSAGAPAAWHIGVTSLAQALLSFEQNDVAAAQQHADEGMAVFRVLGQPYGIGLAFNYQGDAARLHGDHATAVKRYEAALPLLRQANAKSEIPAVLHNLAHVKLMQGDASLAGSLFAEGLELHRENGNRSGMAECLTGLAAVALAQGQPSRAATLLGAVDALLAALSMPLFAADQDLYRRTADAARAELGDEAWVEAWQAGQTKHHSYTHAFA